MQRWSLARAAAAAGVSERTCRKWVGRYRAEGEAGLLDRSSAPRSIPHRTPDELRRGDRRAAAAADDRRGDRVLSGDGALDGLGGAAQGRAGQALPARAAEPPNRYERRAPGRAGSRRRQEARAHPGRRRRAPRPRPASPQRSPRHATASGAVGLGVRARLRRRRHAPGLRRGPRRREGHHRRRLPDAARSRSTPPRHHRRARDERQRRLLPLDASTPSPAARSASVTCAPGPTGRAPTARPSASSAPCSAGWAYGAIYGSSRERTAALDGWLWTYNHRRPHGSLSHKTPDRSPHRAEQRAWVLPRQHRLLPTLTPRTGTDKQQRV